MTVQPSIHSGVSTGIQDKTGVIGGFSPGVMEGLVLWLDASRESSVILNGVNVSQWNDLSGNGNHAAQVSAALQPLYVPPTQTTPGTLTFTNDGLIIPDSTTMRVGTEFSLFMVFDQTVVDAVFRNLLTASITIFRFLDEYVTTGSGGRALDGFGFTAVPTVTSMTKTSGQIPVFKIKSTAVAVDMSFAAFDFTTTGIPWGVGSNNIATGGFWNGDISEILMYNRKLGDAEFDRIHNSLGVKYGLSETTVNILP